MAPKSAQQWDRTSGIHPSFFEWPPPKTLAAWEAVREATRVIQQEAIVPDMRVCWLYNMLESGQLPQNWLADTYPAICQQCEEYGAEMEAASKERDRLSAEFLKQQHEAQLAGKRARATPEVQFPGSTTATPGSSSTASAAAMPAPRAKRAR
jgi:hypothetical protein